MTDPSPTSAEEREARLARALRENLRRRKEQARARVQDATKQPTAPSGGKPVA